MCFLFNYLFFVLFFFFFFQAEDGIRDADVTGVQTCALPILEFSLDQPIGSGAPRGWSSENSNSSGRSRSRRRAKNRDSKRTGTFDRPGQGLSRSEERRVGKEWRMGVWRGQERKKIRGKQAQR